MRPNNNLSALNRKSKTIDTIAREYGFDLVSNGKEEFPSGPWGTGGVGLMTTYHRPAQNEVPPLTLVVEYWLSPKAGDLYKNVGDVTLSVRADAPNNYWFGIPTPPEDIKDAAPRLNAFLQLLKDRELTPQVFKLLTDEHSLGFMYAGKRYYPYAQFPKAAR